MRNHKFYFNVLPQNSLIPCSSMFTNHHIFVRNVHHENVTTLYIHPHTGLTVYIRVYMRNEKALENFHRT